MTVRAYLLPALAALLTAQPSPWTMARFPGTGRSGRFTTTFGQDSDYALNPPSLAANGDGTVADFVTGLLWQQADGGEMTWEKATDYCKALSLGGLTDWRLPFAHEAFSILNHGAANPALDTRVFPRSSAEYWWASETRSGDPTRVWVTNAGGGIGPHPKSETLSAGGAKRFHVRCVHSSLHADSLRSSLTDNNDGTITDNHTGLMWQKADFSAALDWEGALNCSEGLSLGGYNDWRLPNIKELQSINDEHAANPSLDRTYFAGTLPGEYWSSTTLFNQPASAWTVDFTYGIASYRPKNTALRVRSVRGGFAGLAIASAASFTADVPLAPASIGSAFGSLGPIAAVADPAMTLTDSRGASHVVQMLALAPVQVNFVVPSEAAIGIADVSLTAGSRKLASGVLSLERVAPSLFTANADGKGVAAGVALTVAAGGGQTAQLIFDATAPAGSRRGVPIDVSRTGEEVYLLLFGTGMRNATQKAAATVGGLDVGVLGPTAQGEFAGLDQVNLGPLPAALAGRGEVEIRLSADGKLANKVTVLIQ